MNQTARFDATADEMGIMMQIAGRAVMLGVDRDPIQICMDLDATHSNGTPLRLSELLDAEDLDLVHDVCGIGRHLDRNTGKLTDCFLPRYAEVNPSRGEDSNGVVRYEKIDRSDPNRSAKLAKLREQFEQDAATGKVLCLSDLIGNHGM